MALRVFNCKDCGHQMRFGGTHCGKCYAKKEAFQLPGFWYAIIALIIIFVLMGILQILTANL